MMDHMKLHLKVRPIHPLHINELSDADMNARKDACRALLAAFHSQRARGAVLFTDECAIFWSVHSQNIVFWDKENPHFYEELERNPPHVMVWAGLSGTYRFGPFFFHGSVTRQAYHDMLSEWLVPQLQQACIKDTVVLQLDGAPPHISLHVRVYLNKIFPGQWIGRGSEASPAPFAWPIRSPDLTPTDNALWGFIKERVSKMLNRTTEVLRAAVEEAFIHVTGLSAQTSARTWHRIQLCYDNEGLHTDVLNS
jgi:hypothetical protein